MKIIRKNQIIIYTFALMLVTAGYLNYTSNLTKNTLETSSKEVQAIEQETDETQEETQDTEVQEEVNESQEQSEDEKVADIGDATLVSSNDVATDYYTKSKLERNSMYSQMIETYEKILNSSNSLETQKQSATQEIKKINETKNSIMISENLLETKGFKNCVIFVNDDSISVIIDSEQLKKEEIAQIQNIVSRELKSEIENIHITTK